MIFNLGQIRLMCNFWATIFWMGNFLYFSISLFYLLFPWIPRTLIDLLILFSNTSVEKLEMIHMTHKLTIKWSNLKGNMWLWNKKEAKKGDKNSLKAPLKIDLHWNNKCAVNTFWFTFLFTCHTFKSFLMNYLRKTENS